MFENLTSSTKKRKALINEIEKEESLIEDLIQEAAIELVNTTNIYAIKVKKEYSPYDDMYIDEMFLKRSYQADWESVTYHIFEDSSFLSKTDKEIFQKFHDLIENCTFITDSYKNNNFEITASSSK